MYGTCGFWTGAGAEGSSRISICARESLLSRCGCMMICRTHMHTACSQHTNATHTYTVNGAAQPAAAMLHCNGPDTPQNSSLSHLAQDDKVRLVGGESQHDEVGIQAVQAVPCGGRPAGPPPLLAHIAHDLVLALARGVAVRQHDLQQAGAGTGAAGRRLGYRSAVFANSECVIAARTLVCAVRYATAKVYTVEPSRGRCKGQDAGCTVMLRHPGSELRRRWM